MRIAIELSGMPRNIENSYKWLNESILDVLKANRAHWDIFLVTEKTDGDNEFIKLFNPILYDIFDSKNSDIINQMWDKFREHKYEIEPRRNSLIMFENILRCDNLRKSYELENNFNYDIYIRMRTELKFNNQLDINEFHVINDCERPIIFLRKGPNPNNIHWYKDNFAIGNRSGMDIYANCFNNLLHVSKLTQVSTAELILRNWLDLNKDLVVEHTSLDYTLTRN